MQQHCCRGLQAAACAAVVALAVFVCLPGYVGISLHKALQRSQAKVEALQLELASAKAAAEACRTELEEQRQHRQDTTQSQRHGAEMSRAVDGLRQELHMLRGRLHDAQAVIAIKDAAAASARNTTGGGAAPSRSLQAVPPPFDGAECCVWCTTTTSTLAFDTWKITFGEGSGCQQPSPDCMQSVGYPDGYPTDVSCEIVFESDISGVIVAAEAPFSVESGYDFLYVITPEGTTPYTGGNGPTFEPTGSTSIVFTSDFATPSSGWKLCARATCEGFVCPGDMYLRDNPQAQICAGLICNASLDLATCCELGCDAPSAADLGSSYRVPASCVEGGSFRVQDGTCEVSCRGRGAEVSGWGPLQECDQSTQKFVLPECEVERESDFQWLVEAGPCTSFGPGCVASSGVQTSGYGNSEACSIKPIRLDGMVYSQYRLWLTHLETESLSDEVKITDYYTQTYYTYYYGEVVVHPFTRHSGSLGSADPRGPFNVGNIEWTSNAETTGRGWVICAQASCLTMTCPVGYYFNCDSINEWCGTSSCHSAEDQSLCCLPETQEWENATFDLLAPGQARNATDALCFTSTTTTTTTHEYKSPDYTGVLNFVIGETATETELEDALRAAFIRLGNLSSSRRVFLVTFPQPAEGPTAKAVGYIAEQTEVDFRDISDEDLVAEINRDGQVVEEMTFRSTAHRPAAARESFDGYHEYGGYCQDLHPCTAEEGCWRNALTDQTCGSLDALEWCANPPDLITPGPGFEDWAARTGYPFSFYNWIFFESFDPSYPAGSPVFANQVCCTCGGGQCVAGSYVLGPGSHFCAPCLRGQTSIGVNAQNCVDCEPGRYADIMGSSECDDCRRGRYSDTTGASECLACDPGFAAARGNSDPNRPVDPETGRPLDDDGPGGGGRNLRRLQRGGGGGGPGATSCTLCDPGRQTNRDGDGCQPCHRGTFAPNNGTAECEDCVPGKYTDLYARTACKDCAVGFFSDTPGTSECIPCEPGTFTTMNGTSECELCPPGRFTDEYGATECMDCEAGLFMDDPGRTECKICPAGSETTEEGRSYCDLCEPGLFKAAGEINCTYCDPGTFTDSEGQQECKICKVGEYAASPGLTACSLCEPGYFGKFEGLPFCTACLAGEEAPDEGSERCNTCQGGKYTPESATPACLSCALGQYSPLPSSTACVACQIGRYADELGLSECPYCELATFAEETGMERCTRCNDTFPGPIDSWNTWSPPSEEERAAGQKIWKELRGAINRSSCGCKEEWQPRNGVCEECGEGLICHGNGVLDIEDKYAWDGAYSVWDCRLGIEEACPGGEPGSCMPGRDTTVIACAECLDGMVANTDGSCSKCKDADYMVPTFVVIIGLLFAIIAYCLFDSPKRKRPKLSLVLIVASLGQFVTIIQQLGIISLIRVKWGGPLRDVFLFISSVTFFDVQVLRPSCLMVMDIVTLYGVRVGLVFICLCIIVIAHFASQLIQHRHDWRTRWPSLACAVGTVLLTFFVSILSTMLGPMQCKRHPNGRQTVSWYPSVLCWEGGDHTTMIIIGSIACILPILFLAACLWAVRQFPRKLQKATTRFLNAWQFLFFRYTSRAYWYGPVVLVRNALVSCGPVMTSPILQILMLEVVMLSSLMFLLRIMPWRLQKANYVDAIGHLCLLLVTMMASFFIEPDDQESTEFVEIFGVIFIMLIPVAVVLSVVYGVVLLLRSMRRPFQFFLCHHKLGAGCFCRLMKMRLLKTPGVTRKVFIDSDDLKNLDELFDVVAHSTETLVVICSQSILLRPWCVGEITTAHRNKVDVAPIYVNGVEAASEQFIDDYLDYIGDISSLTQFGIDLPMIQDALTWLGQLPSMKMPQEIHDTVIQDSCGSLVKGHWTRSFSLSTKKEPHAEGSKVLIIGDKSDLEATATSFILRDLLNPVIQHKDNMVAGVLSLEDNVADTVKKGLLICTNGCFTLHVLDALIACLDAHASLFPVMCVTNFTFPSEAWMANHHVLIEMDEQKRTRAVSVVQAIFTEIAVDFQPSALSGTEATLGVKAQEIAIRMFGVAALSEKVLQFQAKQRMASARSTGEVTRPLGSSKSLRKENYNSERNSSNDVPASKDQGPLVMPTDTDSTRKFDAYIEDARNNKIEWEQDADGGDFRAFELAV